MRSQFDTDANPVKPRYFSCDICGGYHRKSKMAGRQRVCRHQCEPMPDLLLKCEGVNGCGEMKPYDAFHDYRDRGGLFKRTCKACMSRKGSEYFHKGKKPNNKEKRNEEG